MSALRTNDQYDDLFDKYGQIYNVDPLLGKTVFHLESMGNPNTPNSSAGAGGGMQIMQKLADHYGIDRRDMTQAIPAAMANLAEGLQASGGDPAGALAYYNGGPATRQRWKPETQGYVTKALSYYPQMKLTQYAENTRAGTASDAGGPVMLADAGGAPDEAAFRSRWGLGSTSSLPAPSQDEAAFRTRWGLQPATGSPAAPAVTGNQVASDSAVSSPVPLPAPGDIETTAAQQVAERAQAANVNRTGYAALEPSEPGFAHLLWSAGKPFMDIGETARGLRPIPQGTAALQMAAPIAGVGDLRFGNPLVAVARPASSPVANPLMPAAAPPPVEVPAPTFAPGAGRTFDVDAQGNAVRTGASLAPRGAPPEAAPNPLAPSSLPSVPAAPGAPPAAANPLTTAAPTPIAPLSPIIPPQRAITLSPIEQRIMSVAGSPQPGAVPPGWRWNPSMGTGGYGPAAGAAAAAGPPPGTPPLGTPGYAPTTPGVTPQTAAGLSPTEQAIMGSIHDTPPPAPLIPPLTQAAANKVADQIIQHFHTGNAPRPPANVIVPPGYHPSLTGLTNDPGLATLHRGLESVTGAPAVLAQHNAEAINTAARALQGEPGEAADMHAAVRAQTGPLFENAFANKTEMDPAKVQAATDAADQILGGKNQKRPGVVKYVQQIRDAMNSSAGNRGPESDPEMWHGVQMAINDLLSPLTQNTDAAAQAASSSLMRLKPLVQGAIESGAPGFKIANNTHAELMKPVDAQRYLESLNLTSATGDVRLQAVDSALKSIAKQQAAPGISKAEWVSPDQLKQLTALRNALRMEAARGTGKPINSTTFQNLATNSMVSRIAGNPLANILAGQFAAPGLVGAMGGEALRGLTQAQLAKSEGMVRQALVERLLNVSGKGAESLSGRDAQATGPRGARPGPGAPWNPLKSTP